MPFETPLALIALASVVPLIILYLLRPKPLKVMVPSLMFLMKIQEEKKRFYTSITRLIKDPLFLIQLLVLILLALAAAAFFIETQEPLSGEHTVIIIDSSASMQTDDRFSDAVSEAGDYVSRTNSIILAGSVPVTMLESGSSDAAYQTLGSLEPGATVADISSAVSTGMRMLSDEGGRIVVISDFTNWDGDDPVNARTLAQSYGLDVDYVLVGRTTDNVGIIQGEVEAVDGTYSYTGVVKNYKNSRELVELKITNEDRTITRKLNIPGLSTQQLLVTNLAKGITEISIRGSDSLMVDNTAYISIPKVSTKQVLVVSDTERLPSRTALSLMPNVGTELLEGVPADISPYNVVVIANKERALASNEIATLSSYINGGGKVVFMAGTALSGKNAGTDLQALMPVITGDIVGTDDGVTLEVLQETRLSEDIKFDEVAVYRYLNATERRDTTTLVSTTEGTPMLSYGTIGDGTVVYMGLCDALAEDAWNNFHNLPEYPVFWFKLAGWLGGTGTISDYNLKTGAISALAQAQDIETPDGVENDVNRVLYDEVGVYTVANKQIAVNLYNDRESDTTLEGDELIERAEAEGETNIVRADTYTAKNYLDTYMIIIVFMLVILELLIIKRRGEL
ncbi:MAG: BatA and WFA domain-containing protein [Methanosarcinaceae archaeon]|nr:BatA and WFA domain-containing protein [Methanosarcinaceae archaeon]